MNIKNILNLLIANTIAGQGIFAGPGSPNVVLIFADDLGYGDIGPFGQKLIKTPYLDQMAQDGICLTNFYANSISAPSRASLITGVSSGKSVIRDNYELGSFLDEEEFGQMPLPSGSYTIGRMMQSAGYKTALIGKWGLGGIGSTGVPWQQGFDLFFGYLDQKQAHNYYPTHLWRNEEYVALPHPYLHPHQKLPAGKDPFDDASYEPYKGKAYSNDLMTDEAVRFIKDNKSEPFLLILAYTIPHVSLQVPDESLKEYIGVFDEKPYVGGNGYLPQKYPRSCYAAMITRLDSYIGRIIKLLEELNLDDNTLIIFTSDNGPAGRGGLDSRFFNSAGGLKGAKGSLYEGGIRVPFVAKWPGKIKAGSNSDFSATFWDFMPTFAELANTDAANYTDGISFLPVLTGNIQQQKQREYIYWETHGGRRGMQAVKFDEHWKAVRSNMHGEGEKPVELYNLQEDPFENNNIADKHPDKVKRAISYMDSRQTAIIKEWNFFHLKN